MLIGNKNSASQIESANINNLYSYLLLSDSGNTAVSSDAVDPLLEGYRPSTIDLSSGLTAPENLKLDFIMLFDSCQI
jgi:hypothetical protein